MASNLPLPMARSSLSPSLLYFLHYNTDKKATASFVVQTPFVDNHLLHVCYDSCFLEKLWKVYTSLLSCSQISE